MPKLLSAEADATTFSRGTYVHDAALANNSMAIDCLIRIGAPIDYEKPPEGTPLMDALLKRREDAVRCLAENGANIYHICKSLIKPLMRSPMEAAVIANEPSQIVYLVDLVKNRATDSSDKVRMINITNNWNQYTEHIREYEVYGLASWRAIVGRKWNKGEPEPNWTVRHAAIYNEIVNLNEKLVQT